MCVSSQEIDNECTGIPPFTVLHFIVICRYYVFYKWKVCGTPVLSKSIGAIFLTFAHFISLCHIFVNSHNISNSLIIIITVIIIILYYFIIFYGDL